MFKDFSGQVSIKTTGELIQKQGELEMNSGYYITNDPNLKQGRQTVSLGFFMQQWCHTQVGKVESANDAYGATFYYYCLRVVCWKETLSVDRPGGLVKVLQGRNRQGRPNTY